MKKLLFGFLFVFVGLIAAVLIAPNFVNWNEYRDIITKEVNAATGFNLEIRGNIKIGILPSPALLINDVHVANIEGASTADTLSVDSFEVRVALAPLLSRQLQISSIKLVKPVLSLEILSDGRTNMAFNPPAPGSTAAQPAASSPSKFQPFGALTGGAGTGADSLAIQVDDFVIENGSITFRDDTKGQIETIKNLNGRFALASLSGPMESSGSAVVRGIPMSFAASAGALVQGRTLPFSFDLKVIPGEASLRFSGALTRLNEDPQFKGKLNADGRDLAAFISAIAGGISLPESLARPFGVVANIAGAKTGGEMSDLILKLNGTQGTGAVTVKLGATTDVDIKLAINKLDVDALLAPPKPENSKKKSTAKNVKKGKPKKGISLPLARNLSAGQEKNANQTPFSLKSLPDNLNAVLDLSIAAITYKNSVIRQAKISTTLANQEITISQASALLPGSTDVALFGFVSEDGKSKSPTFDGNVDMSTSNLRGLLDWAGVDVSSIAKDRLRKLSFSGKVVADGKAATLNDIAVQLDGTKMIGAANVAFRARPSFGLNLSIDRLNLDGYLPQSSAKSAQKPPATSGVKTDEKSAEKSTKKATPQPAAISNPLAALAPLGNIDANITVDLKALTVGEVPIKGLKLDATIFNGALELKKLWTANAAGMTVNVTGTIQGLKKPKGAIDPSFQNFKFDVRGKSLARLFSLAKITPPISARQIGAVRFSGTLNGKPSALKVTTNMTMLGGNFSLSGLVKPLQAVSTVDGDFSANHSNLVRLLGRLGSSYRPAGKKTGGINLRGRIKGNAQKMAFSNLTGKALGISLQGRAEMDISNLRPKVTADLKTSTIVIDTILPAKRTAFLDKTLRQIHHALKANPLFIRTATRRKASGFPPGAPWSNEPIDLSFLRGVDSDIQLRSESLRFQKYRVDAVRLESVLTNGVLDLKRLTGKAYGGNIKIDGRVIVDDARNQFQTRFEIAGADTGSLLRSLGTRGFSKGTLNLVGEFRTVGRSTFDLAKMLGGGGTISVRGLNISNAAKKGSALSGIAGLFLSLNQFGGSLTGGKASSKTADFSTSFRMDKGVARFDDMSLASGIGNGSAKGFVDLPNWQINTTGEIEMSQNIVAQFLLHNSRKKPLLPFKISGRLDDPKVKLETAALTKGGIRLPGFASKKLDRLRKKKGIGAILDQIFPQAKSGSSNSGSSGSGSPPPQQPPPQQAPQQQQQQKPRVEDFLKGILKGLGR